MIRCHWVLQHHLLLLINLVDFSPKFLPSVLKLPLLGTFCSQWRTRVRDLEIIVLTNIFYQLPLGFALNTFFYDLVAELELSLWDALPFLSFSLRSLSSRVLHILPIFLWIITNISLNIKLKRHYIKTSLIYWTSRILINLLLLQWTLMNRLIDSIRCLLKFRLICKCSLLVIH